MSEKVKKPIYKRAWFIILAVLIVFIVIGSLGNDEVKTSESSTVKSSETKPSEAPKNETKKEKTYHVGDLLVVGDVEYVVNSVSTTETVGNEYLNTTAKSKYVVVNITVTNKGSEALTINDSFFKLKNGDKTYESDSTAGIYGNENSEFFLESVNPDLSLTGNAYFDVTDEVIASEELQIEVQTGFWGTEKGSIYLNK